MGFQCFLRYSQRLDHSSVEPNALHAPSNQYYTMRSTTLPMETWICHASIRPLYYGSNANGERLGVVNVAAGGISATMSSKSRSTR